MTVESSAAESVAAQLRRRREAAARCEPLEPSAVRDPLDKPTDVGARTLVPRRTRRAAFKAAGITVDGKVILVRAMDARTVLESGGMKPLFSAIGRGWVLDAKKLPDACAALEHAGYRVSVRDRDAG